MIQILWQSSNKKNKWYILSSKHITQNGKIEFHSKQISIKNPSQNKLKLHDEFHISISEIFKEKLISF